MILYDHTHLTTNCCFFYFFIFLSSSLTQELTVSDTPVMMTLLDVHPSGKLCLAYQKSGVVEAVDEVTTDSLKVLSLDPVKVRQDSVG